MKNEEKKQIVLGRTYQRKDGKLVCVYQFDCVLCQYKCVVIGTGEFYSVNEDGRYYTNCSSTSHNDLILWSGYDAGQFDKNIE